MNANYHVAYPATYEGVEQVLARLLGPDGCPWDKKQTRETLAEAFLEECYELVEAIEEGDTAKMLEELGDVLFHVIFQVRLGEDNGEFSREDVLGGLVDKLVRRHTHVFGDQIATGADDAIANWEAAKRQEKAASGGSTLDGVPKNMPALSYAQAVQGRAERAGFDWDDFDGVLAKVAEELAEIEAAGTDSERESELGDLLFSVVNAARWLGIDAETALRGTNRRFFARFTQMERISRERGTTFDTLSLDEKESLWQEAKAAE
ncbi:MAG: nucleoside triphosphate pyrophosphohydrolase [Chloroflexi bacterium]|nr:nucleoside triphosphate pyrophosphohydrolase [Chloroflexota bacterium]